MRLLEVIKRVAWRAWAIQGRGWTADVWLGVARRVVLVFLIASFAQVLAFRWAPVPMSAFMLESLASARIHGDGDWKLAYRWVDWDDISSDVALAVVAAEDCKFPRHHGFDFQAISEAWADYQSHERVRGGSTITQQTARNVFLWRGGGFFRKGLEAYYAVLMETLWPKKRILEVYLNVAELGDGVYGVAAASERFFLKPPDELTTYESALLASVLPSPRRLHADSPSDYVLKRADAVVNAMGKLGRAYVRY